MSIRTTCAECGTPLSGVNLNKKGRLYYCAADFERLSVQEKAENKRLRKELRDYKLMFDGTGKIELITNGSFDTDTDWTKDPDVTITGGEAVWTNALNGTRLAQNGIIKPNQYYKTVYTIKNYVDAEIRVRIGTNYGIPRSANGTYDEIIQAQLNTNFGFEALGTGADLSIDNISVRRA